MEKHNSKPLQGRGNKSERFEVICNCWNYSICMIQYIFSLKITTSPFITSFKIPAGKHIPSLILVLEHGVFLQTSENSHESFSPSPVGDYHYALGPSGFPPPRQAGESLQPHKPLSSSVGSQDAADPETPLQLGGQMGSCSSSGPLIHPGGQAGSCPRPNAALPRRPPRAGGDSPSR